MHYKSLSSSKLFKSIAGSTLLAINETAVINKTPDSIYVLVSQLRPPFILLISCPYQQSPITLTEVTEYISHNALLTNTSSTFQDINHTVHWSKVPSCDKQLAFEKEFLQHSFSHQNDYTNQPFAVDSFMFPQSQGYALLEAYWEEYDSLDSRINRIDRISNDGRNERVIGKTLSRVLEVSVH